MTQRNPRETCIETVQAVNYANGIVKMFPVGQSFMQDDKMQATVQKYREAGFLPDGEGEQGSRERAKSAAEQFPVPAGPGGDRRMPGPLGQAAR